MRRVTMGTRVYQCSPVADGVGAIDAPGARFVLARLEEEQPSADEVTLDLPISIYGGG